MRVTPPFFSQAESFPSLKVLDLTQSGLTAPIPASLMEKVVELGHPGTLGTIGEPPAEVTKITYLSFATTSITELPSWIRQASAIETIDLSGCLQLASLDALELEDTSTSSISGLTSVRLSGCTALPKIPETISQKLFVQNNGVLSFREWVALETLPKNISKNDKIQSVDLTDCSSLKEIPNDLVQKLALSDVDGVLQLSGLRSLSFLPEGLASNTSIQEIDITELISLKSIPSEIVNLIVVPDDGVLNLSGFTKLESLENVCEGFLGRKAIKRINISGCTSLNSVENLLELLIVDSVLDLSGLESLTELPNAIKKLPGLKILKISGCSKLTSIPDDLVPLLINDGVIDLQSCTNLTLLPSIGVKAPGLTKINISSCSSLTSIDPRALRYLLDEDGVLDISGLRKLIEIPDGVNKVDGLTAVKLHGCTSLTNIPPELVQLLYVSPDGVLNLGQLESLTTLPIGIRNLKNLSSIDFKSDYKGIKSIPSEYLPYLKPNGTGQLSLSNFKALTSLPEGLESIGLSTLTLNKCESLEKIPDSLVEYLPVSDGKVDLSWIGITKVPKAIASVNGLKRLDLTGCRQLETIAGVAKFLVTDGKLDLSGLRGLQSLEGISDDIGLKALQITECSSLSSIPKWVVPLLHIDLNGMLDLVGMSKLEELPANLLQELPNLKAIKIGKRDSETSVKTFALKEIPADVAPLLFTNEKDGVLDLSGFINLTTLPETIREAKNLTSVDLRGCSSLNTIPPDLSSKLFVDKGILDLSGLTALGVIPDDVSQCGGLKEV